MKRDYKCSLKRFDTFPYPARLMGEEYTKYGFEKDLK